MNSVSKYLGLLFLIIGGFLAFISLQVAGYYIFKLFSIGLFVMPGFNSFFQYAITTIPYLIILAALWYLFSRMRLTISRINKFISGLLLALGAIACLVFLAADTLHLWKMNWQWMITLNYNFHFLLVGEILIVFTAAALLAAGTPREKDWMEKYKEPNL